jgi:hypothetical protein
MPTERRHPPINGGTDIPPGFGDAWTDPRGMYLSGAVASQVWHHLGWPGLIVPEGTAFTSGPGESIGGTPPIDVAFIDGTVGYRRHYEGHTPNPDWPSFMALAARHFDTSRPVVVPGQRFALGRRRRGAAGGVVGTVRAADAGQNPLGNWQITGGTGVGAFTIDHDTGEISLARRHRLDLPRRAEVTLKVVVDDRKVTSMEETVTIDLRP